MTSATADALTDLHGDLPLAVGAGRYSVEAWVYTSRAIDGQSVFGPAAEFDLNIGK
jgi:hypothetical protein